MVTTPKVLIIDDSNTECHVMRQALQGAGYQVLIANDGIQGLRVMTQERPQCLVLDIVLPGINGFEVCRQLRSQDTWRDLPIIMVSTKNSSSDRFWAMRQGANYYLVKPFKGEELVQVVESLLAGRSEQNVSGQALPSTRPPLSSFGQVRQETGPITSRPVQTQQQHTPPPEFESLRRPAFTQGPISESGLTGSLTGQQPPFAGPSSGAHPAINPFAPRNNSEPLRPMQNETGSQRSASGLPETGSQRSASGFPETGSQRSASGFHETGVPNATRSSSTTGQWAIKTDRPQQSFERPQQSQQQPFPAAKPSANAQAGSGSLFLNLIPRRSERAEMLWSGGPDSLFIADRAARQLYLAIDGKNSVEKLCALTGMSKEDVFKALRVLVAQQRIQLYDGQGRQFDSFFLQ